MKLIHTCIALSLAGALSAVPWRRNSNRRSRRRPITRAHKNPEPVTGEILAVDDKAKTIVVKTAAETEMKFSYSDETEIVGGEKGPAGLATSTGTIVTVTYGVHGTTNVAIKIE